VREVISDTDAALEFTAEIDGIHSIHINGVDMIHWNAEGRISRSTGRELRHPEDTPTARRL
jgi:hypothetical protein